MNDGESLLCATARRLAGIEAVENVITVCASGRERLGGGATFTPIAEIGLRHDGGDAETGTGVEIGAGLRYTAGPLTIEGQVRSLVTHEDNDYEEWGMSGAIRVTPNKGRGLTLSIAPAWGRTGSAADRLWSAHDARALGADSEFEADSQIAIAIDGNRGGYGFGMARPGTRTARARRAHALHRHDARRCRSPHGAHRCPLEAEPRYRRQR